MGILEDTDERLHEWSLWVRTPDGYRLSWASATPFGRFIVPDPVPPREFVDYERAAQVDAVLAKLPSRMRFILKVHYLDGSPTQAKARRMGVSRHAYMVKLTRLQFVVAYRLNPDVARCISVQTAVSA